MRLVLYEKRQGSNPISNDSAVVLPNKQLVDQLKASVKDSPADESVNRATKVEHEMNVLRNSR